MSQETIYQILDQAPCDWDSDEDIWETTYLILDTLK